MSDRSDEKREGWVPSGRRGWLKVGGERRTEIQPVTPGWAKALRNDAREKKRTVDKMTDIYNYRTAFRDAEGRPFPREGEIRVFLDDDIVDRRAPEGWVHARTVREVCKI